MKAFNEYFSGRTGVFRSPKNRGDIPDAIILQSILELSDKTKKLSVICKDNNFHGYLNTLDNIKAFKSICEFLKDHPDETKILSEIDSENNVVQYMRGVAFNEFLNTLLMNSRDEVLEIYLEEEDIRNLQFYNHEYGIRLQFVDIDSLNEFKTGEVLHLGKSKFQVGISFEATGVLNYCGFYEDYQHLENAIHHHHSIDSMNGDGVCDISEIRRFTFYGFYEFEVSPVSQIETVDQLIKNLDCNQDRSKIKIEYAELL